MKKKHRQKFKKPEINEEIMSSISSPNVWTKEVEDAWLSQPGKEIKRRFPPIGRPRHIQRTAKANYFLDQKERK